MRSSGATLAFYGASPDGQIAYFDDGEGAVAWNHGELKDLTSLYLAPAPPTMTDSGQYFAWIDADGQVRLYDAGTDKTVCPSCVADSGPVLPVHLVPRQRGLNNQPPRAITEDGTLFFSTATRLVPADHNGVEDVYSYKNGRLTLISPGVSNDPAKFIDVTANGSDVYFETNEGLVSQDTDGAPDVYDARVGGGIPSQNPARPPAECVHAACSDQAVSQVGLPSPSSMSGAGNAKAASVGVSGRRTVKGSVAKLMVQVSDAGKISITGSQIHKANRSASKAGRYAVAVKLTGAAKKSLKRSGEIGVGVQVSYRSSSGDEATKALTLEFKQPNAKKKGGR
jgi:hypothetical protein